MIYGEICPYIYDHLFHKMDNISMETYIVQFLLNYYKANKLLQVILSLCLLIYIVL